MMLHIKCWSPLKNVESDEAPKNLTKPDHATPEYYLSWEPKRAQDVKVWRAVAITVHFADIIRTKLTDKSTTSGKG